jgi:alkanesulfonate monooxygenase SsuD/methylene tetrahydromethanopterin reductase-like flavin-dependent oxidoreductase (luciferase family)
VGKYADGYATVDPFKGNIKNLWPIIDKAARDAGRNPEQLSKNVELFVSYSKNYDDALASARRWKSALIPNILNLPIADPRELELRGKQISDKDLAKEWTITTDPEDIVKKADDAIGLGFNEIQFHSASPSEEDFLNMCHGNVLPPLKQKFASS